MTSSVSRVVSRLGIGTYRFALGVPEHERVFYKALERQQDPRHNITLIDTSTNYANGRSEQLIGKVLSNPQHNTLTRDELVIATKFGYIQNENMRLLSEGVFKRVPPEEIVEYSNECYHCIHPEFMRDQLTRSLERLKTKFVDILFVHNPEYYLMTNVNNPESNVKKHQGILLNRLALLFEELEREIDRGRIRAYGISSNSFSLKPSHGHFLPYQDLVKIATTASERVRAQKQAQGTMAGRHRTPLRPKVEGVATTNSARQGTWSEDHIRPSPATPNTLSRTSHGFGFLQMPGNLLEMEGVQTTAKWAKAQGLSVFLNRPLNAMSPDHHPVRLASYPAPQSPTYLEAKAQVLEALSRLGQQREYLQHKMQRLRTMIEGLDASLQTNHLSIIHMEGASIQSQLHSELASPIKTFHTPSSSPRSQQAPENKKQAFTDGEGDKGRHSQNQGQTNSDKKSNPSQLSQPISLKPSAEEVENLVQHLDHFVRVFHQQVRSQETQRVTKMLTDRGIDLKGESIEQFAVEYLLEHTQVDSVLLGMKREPYVDFARKVLCSLLDEESKQ
ncbi:NADP-dependent oxidoreductase domain-containing protein [Lobosporangium transversale]|uniref:NADP-dependent oxidoreductase domain-containing protein n=1 Tax=Lobosporangium transversale TaxID=64571 RepID=A0A1Y2GV38_9FUNG|nr:NADP-dependent oxidoreductase domain-containing protein [Lobosporangium transversale]ORZ24933.1 NADP-dependent oxidoreductase domain-containing protein [Lobosporangium transversale]|eukprot:XP_021883914.1 NADP-dependent oxidoreductase domain-containing protein [Lobosporangium transversale]